MSPQQQGAQANRQGQNLEGQVETILIASGYHKVKANKYDNEVLSNPRPVFARQYKINNNLYRQTSKIDFILFHPTIHPDGLIIECKWQQSAGSVDEKFPYLAINIRAHYNKKGIVIVDGGGFRPGGVNWLKSQIDGNRLLHVFSLSEFMVWVNQGNI